MAFDFIKAGELATTFNDALKFATPLHEPFEEFERIARNRPHPGIDKDLPKVTDGTLASIIQEKPKRTIQQIPTGKIKAPDEWLEVASQFILENEILANSEEEAEEIQKCWVAISKAMTYGSQASFVKFIQRGTYFGTDFVLPYAKDVILEPGKVSDRASNIIFLRSWWSKNQIRQLIDAQSNLKKKAEDRGDTFESGWNLKALSNLLEEGLKQKDQNAQTPGEKGKMLNAGFYELVHCFQRGIEGSFYTFSPIMENDENVLRTKTNPDPRGQMPIDFLYADQDFSNPLGRGAVEMSGGMQNLIDSEVQMYQYTRALMLRPPMKKKGEWSKANAKFVPNHIIEMGSDPNADIEPLAIDSTALQGFPTNYGLMKSQILNLNNSLDTSVSQESGNPGFSKTPQGVNAMSERLGISDNHMRKQFETWWARMTETRLNLYFAERHGVQELTVDEETAYKLNQIKPGSVNDQSQIRIDYDDETPHLKFQIDASSSDMKDNQVQLEALDGLLERYEKSQTLQQLIPQKKIIAVWNQAVSASGVENPEKLAIELDPTGNIKQEAGDQQQQQSQMTPEMVQQMIEQAMQKNDANDPKNHPVARVMAALNIKGTDLDPNTLRTLINILMQQLGAPGPVATGPLPMEVDMAGKMADTRVKLHDANLKTKQHINDGTIAAVDAATKLHQATNQNESDAHSRGMAEADQELRAEQAKQAAKQPAGAAK
jgi:hypothetical protein